MFERAAKRAEEFGISGVSYFFTLVRRPPWAHAAPVARALTRRPRRPPAPCVLRAS